MPPVLLLLSLLAASARADDTDELARWAAGFDTTRSSSPRSARPGDYRTNFGTLLDPSCLRGLAPEARDLATLEFENDVATVLERVRACHERWLWLGGLLSDAVSVLRRSVVTCASAEAAGVDDTAGAVAYPIHTRDTPRSHGREMGRPARGGRLYYLTMIARDLADFHQRRPAEQRAEFYFHETLHYTGSNNLADHDEVEAILYGEGNACERNAFDDRVIFLVALCGFPGHGSLREIGDRIRRCGLERGCMRSLTRVEPHRGARLIAPHMYGAPYSDGDARLLCQRIRDETTADARALAAVQAAAERARRVNEVMLGAVRRAGLLAEAPYPAPRFLAALSPAERTAIAAVPGRWGELPKVCVARRDGTMALGDQPRECPLSDALDGSRAASRLLAAHNAEVELSVRSLAASAFLVSFFKMRREAGELERVEREVREDYGRLCPGGDEDFRPSLCDAGLETLLAAVADVRRAAARRERLP